MNKRKAFYSTIALSVVISLIAVVPQQAFAQTDKGIELYNSGKYVESGNVLRAVLKADPQNTQAKFYLGLSLLMQQNYREALDTFLAVKKSLDRADRRARPAVPNEFQVQIALARARLGLRQFQQAWENLESARKEDSSASDVYVYRGVYYLEQEKYDEAIKELEKAISLDDRNPYAYYYSGMAYYKTGNGEKAAEDLKTFIKLAPNAPEVEKARETLNLC